MEIPKDLYEEWQEIAESIYTGDSEGHRISRLYIITLLHNTYMRGQISELRLKISHYETLLEVNITLEDEDDDIDEDGYGRDGLPVTKPPKGLYKVSDEDLEKLEKLWNKDLDL